jgi:hypothetical protein
MTIPAYVLGFTPPNLLPYQFWYTGEIFGVGGNGVNWKELDGFDISNIRTGDSGRPRDQGEYIGYDFLSGRDITLKLDCQNTGATTLQQNLLTLSTAFQPQANIETPMYFNLPYFQTLIGDPLVCMVRPRNRSWKVDITYSLGKLAQDLQVMVHATDPRFYSSPTAETEVTTTTVLDNIGNYGCRPLVTWSGPQTNPSITNGTSTLGFTYSLQALGQDGTHPEVIVADFYYQTVMIANQVGNTGANATPFSYMLTPGSSWFTLVPGSNSLVSAGGAAYVDWASAWLL